MALSLQNDGDFHGTASWLQGQWSNPSDIFTILLIIGGDVVQVAIAQLCAGPIPYLTPVVFSFGWVTYAVSAMLSAVGDNTLMPKPELDCVVINAHNGYKRDNCSWVLSRILRDFDYWKDPKCERVEEEKLLQLKADNRASEKPKAEEEVAISLRVTVWQCIDSTHSKASGDLVYWAGLLVASIQLGVAAIPWGLHGEWLTFWATGVGTLLAFASGALPQWRNEKFGVRKRSRGKRKDVFLTRGNGDHDALLLLGCEGGVDLEALAAPWRPRNVGSGQLTRSLSIALAVCWIALLISIAGYQQRTWYLVAVGMIGIFHNVAVAGVPRRPEAFGIDLAYKRTFVEGKTMAVLWAVEEAYPKAGASLIEEFFPGKLFPREGSLWEYADRRYQAFHDAAKAYRKAVGRTDDLKQPQLWDMPPLRRPVERHDDNDIPQQGEYQVAVDPGPVGSKTRDHVVQVD